MQRLIILIALIFVVSVNVFRVGDDLLRVELGLDPNAAKPLIVHLNEGKDATVHAWTYEPRLDDNGHLRVIVIMYIKDGDK